MFPIRIKIWHKLFFSILLVVMLILAINMGVSRFSFQQGFNEFIEEVRLKRLDSFSQTLGALYQERGDWTFLKQEPLLWHRLLSESELAPPPPPRGRGPQGHPGRRPPQEFDRPPPHLLDEPGPPSSRFMQEQIGLLDQALAPVVGPVPEATDRRLPITLGGKVVGYLTLRINQSFRTQIERQFASKQLENLLLTALLSFVIAVIAALLLARVFNRPIARLAEMARQLTSGLFESRAQVNTGDELGDLAADLNTLAETLDHNQQSRRQWIADISHELRTPLTVLRGELEAMEDGVRPVNSESIQSLSLEVKQLQRLVEDLYQLSLSDMGSLSYEKTPVDPVKLLRQVTEGFTLSMGQKAITLTMNCESDAVVFADPQRLTQLFTNLLENSLRYTDEGGAVNVHCEEGASLMIHFEDSAPGVSPELFPKLFDRLFRVEGSRNRDSGGSGLGLSIAQSIAQAHGGRLTAEASSLGGLKVSLMLPIQSTRKI
ncbi:ATP-binding protein [Sedimenticola selenatireducens]|uniref:histidine kinase n=1 Tax=Sedimenticola selenatireducens TaxID=191960 RepID=A0A557SM03_9GAMM|nr:ATP-binding protein [Sedimenticola selenatireducens]TVO78439.1 HAMP domain-containing protein [Sedimenticola selenatireducens]TVT62702.1 MAG: HAMP domain-containing protein [Sedimenticola selenatireducens]